MTVPVTVFFILKIHEPEKFSIIKNSLETGSFEHKKERPR